MIEHFRNYIKPNQEFLLVEPEIVENYECWKLMHGTIQRKLSNKSDHTNNF